MRSGTAAAGHTGSTRPSFGAEASAISQPTSTAKATISTIKVSSGTVMVALYYAGRRRRTRRRPPPARCLNGINRPPTPYATRRGARRHASGPPQGKPCRRSSSERTAGGKPPTTAARKGDRIQHRPPRTAPLRTSRPHVSGRSSTRGTAHTGSTRLRGAPFPLGPRQGTSMIEPVQEAAVTPASQCSRKRLMKASILFSTIGRRL